MLCFGLSIVPQRGSRDEEQTHARVMHVIHIFGNVEKLTLILADLQRETTSCLREDCIKFTFFFFFDRLPENKSQRHITC